MDIQHEKHLEQIRIGSDMDLRTKYEKGQKEHGGDLWKKGIATLIAPEIRAEAIDLVVYTDCLTRGLKQIREICHQRLDLCLHQSLEGLALLEILKVLDGEVQELK